MTREEILEQANFFNKNKFKDNDWNHGRALIQIDNFVDMLDENGREFIEKIYSSLQGCITIMIKRIIKFIF